MIYIYLQIYHYICTEIYCYILYMCIQRRQKPCSSPTNHWVKIV